MAAKLNHKAVLSILPDRKEDTHKGDYGRILLLCGSIGYTGAAALAAMGALRVGAGLVYLGVPESIYGIEATKLLEPIVLPLKDHKGKFSTEAWYEIEKLIPRMDAVLVGPGIGCNADVTAFVVRLFESYNGPMVLDADGINCLCSHIDILRGRKEPIVITPHQGEFERLLGGRVSNRSADAFRVARELGITVVLKGHRTVITDGEQVFINETGNPGMAVGGSGDILAGMIVGLIGQGIDPTLAAAVGAWLHGAAGDCCAEEMGQYGMIPSDMLKFIPRLMK